MNATDQETPRNAEAVDTQKQKSQVAGMLDPTPSSTDPSNLFAFDEYLKGRNLTRTTGYRYRKQGLLETVNIFGRLYVTRQEIEKFEARAIAGEFHKDAKTPTRKDLTA